MATPFALRWEVSSLRSNHGSFVEAAKVKPLLDQSTSDCWVERPVVDLQPAHLARVQRRWWLASQLTSPAWPALIDHGDEGGAPWAVIESPGGRLDGTFPFPEPQLALKAARGLALGVAEAEALLSKYCTSSHLGLRASVLARDASGRLRLHLAALDPEPDLGFPLTPSTWMWTAEALFGQPETPRSNVFALGWMLCLMLTGRSPYGATAEGHSEKAAKDALRPLVAGGKLVLGLPDSLKAVEPVLRRALSPSAAQRYANAAAFAEALAPMAPGTVQPRTLDEKLPKLRVPPLDPRFEVISPVLEARLLNATDDSSTWGELARELDVVQSPRAKLIRGELSGQAALTPALAGEKLTMTWRHGYVRALSVEPAAKSFETSEARILELTALLQHPSLHFLNDLTLAGPLAHAKVWLSVLQRFAPPALRRVMTESIAASDPFAVDIAFRFPRWTWVWGQPAPVGIFEKWFGR
ncbi:MAG: hypothetical protein Q8N23_29565 [Archangium sp.]|nr:hypothetical protein [Archangium sp.]MDP3156855.1 hypothetical protein [Archangium sp.]MDP3575532.1 hypothetical protein [Archangium sp.]